jgi:hypothetical protein
MKAAGPVTTQVFAGGGWHVTHAADLDGDGKADLVWTDDAGRYGGWIMNGATATSIALFFDGPGSGWHIVGIQDLDGDHKADFLWRHDSGQYGGWLMKGLGPTDIRTLLSPGTRWEASP